MKILSTVKYKVALASTALFVSASSFAAEGATGGTDYAGQAMDALLTQAMISLVKYGLLLWLWLALGLPFVFSKILFKSGLNFTQGHSLPLY